MFSGKVYSAQYTLLFLGPCYISIIFALESFHSPRMLLEKEINIRISWSCLILGNHSEFINLYFSSSCYASYLADAFLYPTFVPDVRVMRKSIRSDFSRREKLGGVIPHSILMSGVCRLVFSSDFYLTLLSSLVLHRWVVEAINILNYQFILLFSRAIFWQSVLPSFQSILYCWIGGIVVLHGLCL